MVALSGKDVMAWVGLRTWAREAELCLGGNTAYRSSAVRLSS
jgi:hypothetical protein